jgi:DNA-binding SARP family transcriptional activator
MLAVRLIGPFAVTRDGVAVERAELGSRKGRELLALLAVERGRTVPVDRIVEVLWAGTSPKDPTASVATLVSRLRRALGVEVVRGGRNGYRLGHPPGVLVDLDEASRWIDEAERRTTAGEAALGVSAGLRSVELLSADGVLVDEPAAEWMEPARGEVVELLRRSRHVLADAALATGDHVLATRTAEAAVAADPYDEPARRALMSAHLAAGEPARALSTYADLQQLLASGLGVDPASETRLLHLAILRQEQPPATQVMTSVAAPVSDTLGLPLPGAQVWSWSSARPASVRPDSSTSSHGSRRAREAPCWRRAAIRVNDRCFSSPLSRRPPPLCGPCRRRC